MKKVALIIGHNRTARGAVRTTDNLTEFVQMAVTLVPLVAKRLEELGVATRVFERVPSGSYPREIAEVYGRVDAYDPDVSAEFHFNGSDDPTATGTEVLSSGSALSVLAANHIQRQMWSALGLRNRGVKIRDRGRGSLALRSGRAPAVLLEPYFGSNTGDCDAFDTRLEQVADAIADGIAVAVRAMPRRDLSQSRTNAVLDKEAALSRTGAAVAATGTATAVAAPTVVESLRTARRAADEAMTVIPPSGMWENIIPYLPVLFIAAMFLIQFIHRSRAARLRAIRADDHRSSQMIYQSTASTAAPHTLVTPDPDDVIEP